MKIWLDAQLPPALARWFQEQPWGIKAVAVRDIGMRDASDPEIFAEDFRRSARSRCSCHDQGSGFHPTTGCSRPSSTGHLVAAGQHEHGGLERSVEQDTAAGSGAAEAGRTLRGDQAPRNREH